MDGNVLKEERRRKRWRRGLPFLFHHLSQKLGDLGQACPSSEPLTTDTYNSQCLRLSKRRIDAQRPRRFRMTAVASHFRSCAAEPAQLWS